MHQGQQVAAELALVGVALEYFLRVVGVDRDFLPSAVVSRATKLAVDSDFSSSAFHIQRNAALRGRSFESGLGLQSVDVDVSNRFVHSNVNGVCHTNSPNFKSQIDRSVF